jgi:hypothetical protein
MKIYKMMFEIHNSQTGDVKTVDMSEWLGHYQFDDNWTIYKDYHVEC